MPPEERLDHNVVDEPELVRRAKDGCRTSFGVLVNRYSRSVRRVARSICGDDARGDEAAQDAFLLAYRKLNRLEDVDAFRPWLMRITRNRALETIRRRAGEPSRHEELDSIEHLGIAAGWGTRSPERIAERRQRLLHVAKALDALSPEDREIIVLRDIEGVSGPEVAEVLGVHLNAAKSRLHRARLRLMAQLREVGAHE